MESGVRADRVPRVPARGGSADPRPATEFVERRDGIVALVDQILGRGMRSALVRSALTIFERAAP